MVQKYANKDGIKTLLWIAVGIFVVSILYKVYAKFFGKDEVPPEDKLTEGEKATIDAIRDIEVNDAQTTITTVQAKSLADRYFKEIVSPLYCDEDTIHELFSPLTGNDLLMIYKAFGVKKYQPYFWSNAEYLSAVQYPLKSVGTQATRNVINTYWKKANLA